MTFVSFLPVLFRPGLLRRMLLFLNIINRLDFDIGRVLTLFLIFFFAYGFAKNIFQVIF